MLCKPLRSFALVAIGAIALLTLTSRAAAAETSFAIEAQELASALKAFAIQSRREIFFAPELARGKHTQGVTGNLDELAALDVILRGTGLSYTLTESNAILLRGGAQRSSAAEARTSGAHTRLAQAKQSTSASARAQVAAGDSKNSLVLEEIVVTATKRRSSLQDVPLSVSVITAEDIRTRGYTKHADYLNSVPGVFFIDSGPGQSTIQIRGLAASEGRVRNSTTATYFGEAVTSVLTNFGGKPDLRLVDIERVEVLRGPQGTLFGANSLAGVVRIIPAAPDLEEFEAHFGTRGFMTAHSDDESYEVEGVVNIPLIQDRLALRVVGYQEETAGYIDNIFPGQPAVDYSAAVGFPDGTLITPAIAPFTRKDINSEDTWGARAALSWQPTDRLRLDFTYATQEIEFDSEPFTHPAVGEYAQSRGLDAFAEGALEEHFDLRSLVLSYDWDAVSLVSATNWASMERFTSTDISFLGPLLFGAPIPWSSADRSWGDSYTQEVRLQSRGEGALQWIVGAYYLKQEMDGAQAIPDFSCPTCLPVVLNGENFAFDFSRSRLAEQEQRSIFGEVSYQFIPRWTLGVGVRYLEEDLTSLRGPARGLLGGGDGGVIPAEPTLTGSVDEINPSAYLRFEPAQEMTMYLQAARGFRSGSINPLLPEECAQEAAERGLGRVTDPDTLWNYELGLKSLLAGGRLSINTAVYKQKWEGVQLGLLLTCGFNQAFNGGDVEGEGAELELQARLGQAWRFNLAASVNQNEFASVRASGVGFAVGERVPDAPENNGSAGVQYDFSLRGQWSGFARADYVYVGNLRLKLGQDELGQDIIGQQDSFNSTNVRLGFQRDNLAVELFGNNITDERSVVVTGIVDTVLLQNLLRPREVGVELRYSYR